MKIESLEIKLLKSSEIKDGDIILVKIKDSDKLKLDKDKIKHLYDQISKMLNRSIPIYFFPDNLSIDIIKKSVNMTNNTIQNENINT
jgi:hypothetical protein